MSEIDLPLPKDPRHQRFADLVLVGETPPKAYKKAGFTAKTAGSLNTNSSRLLKNAEVVAYMNAVRQRAAKGKVMDVQEKREFLARIVRTPLRSIDPNDPEHKDGDLILKYKYTSNESSTVEEIVKPDPLRAIAEDNKLSGDDPEANATQAIADALAALGKSGGTLPVDKM